MEKINIEAAKHFKLALEYTEKEIKSLESEENRNLVLKGQVISEIVAKINCTINEIVLGKK